MTRSKNNQEGEFAERLMTGNTGSEESKKKIPQWNKQTEREMEMEKRRKRKCDKQEEKYNNDNKTQKQS